MCWIYYMTIASLQTPTHIATVYLVLTIGINDIMLKKKKKRKPGVEDPTLDCSPKHLHEQGVIKKENVNVDIGKHFPLPYRHRFC